MLLKSLYQHKLVHRHFHTSSPRHVNPLLWVFLKPALKGLAWITGRSTRKWYRQLPLEKRNIFIQHLDRQKYRYMGIFGTIGAAFAAHYYTHLETAPITGRRRYMMIDSQFLEEMCKMETEKMANTFANQMYPVDSKPTQLVARVAKRLLNANMDIPEVKRIRWTVRVVDTEMKNAFVLPSGDMYITRGMMRTMTNEDQLAVVLAHELSHALLGHSGEKISYGQVIDTLAIFGAFIIWSIFPTDWTSFWVNFIFDRFITYTAHLPYSRSLEEEADEVGLVLAAKACYDVRESVSFWNSVDKADKQLEIPEFMSTHPQSGKRAQNLEKSLPAALDIRLQCKCAPLPENKALGVLKVDRHPEERIMEPMQKRLSGFQHAPVVETTK